ncbi:hypothetical protein [Streptomyces sp. NPDC050145]|uniref:hypothetical protein n=1 Tax=Streptomyces sp. NPDC050145 TaxID=3365602 RepID=UPI00379876E3
MSVQITVGDRVELAADVHALGVTHRRGARGIVREVHTGGHLTLRMSDGRVQFPHRDEVTVIDAP